MKLQILTFFLLIMVSICQGQVNIMVNSGPFATVEEAANGEEMINFFDEDLTDDRACTESFAAVELAKFLPGATFIKQDEINFICTEVLPKDGHVFILGSQFTNPLIKKYDYPEKQDFKNEQSYSIRSFKENGRIITIIEGADRIGTLYGVYRYLEEIGIRFFGLGEKGTVYPSAPSELQVDLNILENPSYLTRGFYSWDDRRPDREFFLWMARNKFNYWTAQEQPVKFLKKLGMKLSDGGHRIQGVVFDADSEYHYNHPLFEGQGDDKKPDDPYEVSEYYSGDVNNDGILSNFEAHPEWYGMRNGERIKISYSTNAAQRGINFCTSNEDARQEFAKRVVKQLIDGQWRYVDVFELWMFDGHADLWCTCDHCNEAGSYTDKMIMVTHDLLKELAKNRNKGKIRRVEVSNIAYHATLEPPTRQLPDDYDYQNSSVTFFPIGRCFAHSLADPACTEINQWHLETYHGWTLGEKRYYKGDVFIGEYYNVSSFKTLPVVLTKIMSVDIPWYYRIGARHFHYMHTPDSMWGTWTLNQYLMGKLLWNINSDSGSLIDDYFTLYYPTTGYTTRKFYEQLEKATANLKALKHYVKPSNDITYTLRGRLRKGDPFELDHLKYDQVNPLLNDGLDIVGMINAMDMAKKYLDMSLIKCRNNTEQQRLKEDKGRFDYGYATYRFIYHIVRTYIFHTRGDKIMAEMEFVIVEKYAEELRKMVDVVQVSSDHSNAANGLEAAQLNAVFNEYKEIYGK